MIPTLFDLRTGKTAKGDDQSVYWWTEGNGSCDCNRAIHFAESVQGEMDATMRASHPGIRPHQGYCYGCKRFIAIDVEGDLEGYGDNKEQVLVAMNSEYCR